MKSLVQFTLITLISLVFIAACSKGNEVATTESLTNHLVKTDPTIKLNPLVEAFSALEKDPEKKKEMIEKAKAHYAKLNVKNMYLVSGSVDGKENVVGSLIEFTKVLTSEEANAQLSQDSFYKNQEVNLIMNGNFAFSVSEMNGKTMTPDSIIAAFKNFK